MRCSARDLRQTTLRIFLPPLTITVALLTAATLLVTAATIVTPPLPAAVGAVEIETAPSSASPSPFGGAAMPREDFTMTLLGQDASALLAPAPCIVELARLTYAPKSGGPSQTPPGPWLLVVETGDLAVQLHGTGTLVRAAVPAQVVNGELTLHEGDGVALPATTAAAFHNGGPTPVVALAAGVFTIGATNRTPPNIAPALWDDDWSPGATVEPLAGGWLIYPPTNPAVIDLTRVSLETGARMSLASSGAIALAVEAGALTLLPGHGLMWLESRANPDGWVDSAGSRTLLSGDRALLEDRPQVTIRNDGSGPLLLLVLTVTSPTDPTASPPDGR